MSPHLPKWASFLSATAILGLTIYWLIHSLAGLSVAEIESGIHNVAAEKLAICGILTCVSFLALGSYDIIAVFIVAGHRVSLGRSWFAGAVANAISNTLGFHALTATAVRYRILARSGLCRSEIAGVTALSWTALVFGFAATLSLAMLASPDASLRQRAGGFALLGILLLSVLWLGASKRIAVRGYIFELPSGRMALIQMALGAVEMASAIGALYILMPESVVISFPAFSALYIGAVLLGIASHAPGGLGVFEATMLTLSHGPARAAVLVALLVYRVIYNVCPFLLAVAALAGEEIRAVISSRAGNA